METKLESAKRTLCIGSSLPPAIIGERINLTNRQELIEEVKGGVFAKVRDEAIRQMEAGAQAIDLNLAAPGLDEPLAMERAVEALQDAVDIPLVIDSTDPSVIERGLRAVKGRPLVNSVSGKEESLEAILPLVKNFKVSVVGLTLDERGIPPSADGRLKVAERIVERGKKFGLQPQDILIDCLALSVGTNQREVMETLYAIRMVEDELGVNTILGLSNISFGMPRRSLINATFLGMAIAFGVDGLILNPLDPEVMQALRAASLLTGRDEYGRDFISKFRGKR